MSKIYSVTLTGISPLLLHSDSIEFQDDLKKWRLVPANKKLSVAGDDRSPAWSWLGCLYHDGVNVTMPSDNLMRCLLEGGTGVVVPGGRGTKTFKSQTQSGMMVTEEAWPILIDGKPVPFGPLAALREESEFADHKTICAEMGIDLFVKRAKIGTSKHVRVRPRFHRWSLSGTLSVWDDQITLAVLEDILEICGSQKGLGDWRPSGRTPGPYGRFTSTIKLIK